MFTALKCGKGALQNKRFPKRLLLTPLLTTEMVFSSNTRRIISEKKLFRPEVHIKWLHTSKKAEILTLNFFFNSLLFVLNFDSY